MSGAVNNKILVHAVYSAILVADIQTSKLKNNSRWLVIDSLTARYPCILVRQNQYWLVLKLS